MEEVRSNPTEPSIAEEFGFKQRQKKAASKKKSQPLTNDEVVEPENSTAFAEDCSNSGVRFSVFDHSVENHFRALDMICKLCGEEDVTDSIDNDKIKHFSSRVTFWREWRDFNYESRVIKFASDMQSTQEKDSVTGINLPQFSSATVPREVESGEKASSQSRKDFIMYVGGPVWGVDWCPHNLEKPDCRIKCEFVAVAAHPPGSSYHKIGDPLNGTGIVQIWCLLTLGMNEDDSITQRPKKRRKSEKEVTNESSQPKRPRGRPRKYPIDKPVDGDTTEDMSTQTKKPRRKPRKNLIDSPLDGDTSKDKFTKLKKPRGRPKKKPADESVDYLASNDQNFQALAIQFSENSPELLPIEDVPGTGSIQEQSTSEVQIEKPKSRKLEGSASDSVPKLPVRKRRPKVKSAKQKDGIFQPPLAIEENRESSMIKDQIYTSCQQDLLGPNAVVGTSSVETGSVSCSIPNEVASPRLLLCLAHNGKVAWDVKWRPSSGHISKCKYQMGFLAVLLGNGSLEVWEIPLPGTMKLLYSFAHEEGVDPRFLKLQPVFKCTTLKCCERKSIPLTLEWSTSPPHDYLLAGCHDGTVVLWKFSASSSSVVNDTRPLLCFNADSVPIRAVGWAPHMSDQESPNVIVTAGHEGLKFWDIRDPFRPLWDIHPAPRFIYSLDWLQDPGCVIISLDDGTMRLLSLLKAAYDVPFNEQAVVIKPPGLHTFYCTSFAIWSVHVSRITGMVAYCSADGTVHCFQLTHKAVEKDPSRHRAPHFLCGSLTEEDTAVTVNTPFVHTPLTKKKPANDSGDPHRWLPESNCTKRIITKKAEAQNSENETLAICYGDDPYVEPEFETLQPSNSNKAPKSRSSSKGKRKDERALVRIYEEQERENGKDGTGSNFEEFPPKIVAMHRVRWNMNKGSERWLCYGGAAGILRCQEIDMPDF